MRMHRLLPRDKLARLLLQWCTHHAVPSPTLVGTLTIAAGHAEMQEKVRGCSRAVVLPPLGVPSAYGVFGNGDRIPIMFVNRRAFHELCRAWLFLPSTTSKTNPASLVGSPPFLGRTYHYRWQSGTVMAAIDRVLLSLILLETTISQTAHGTNQALCLHTEYEAHLVCYVKPSLYPPTSPRKFFHYYYFSGQRKYHSLQPTPFLLEPISTSPSAIELNILRSNPALHAIPASS
jgi:hypothetical protein